MQKSIFFDTVSPSYLCMSYLLCWLLVVLFIFVILLYQYCCILISFPIPCFPSSLPNCHTCTSSITLLVLCFPDILLLNPYHFLPKFGGDKITHFHLILWLCTVIILIHLFMGSLTNTPVSVFLQLDVNHFHTLLIVFGWCQLPVRHTLKLSYCT